MQPDVALSVVVTNYNYGRFVATAIESVLCDEPADVEVVVVDDGSTDGSLEVLATFGERIRLVTQPHQGMAAAFTTGFHNSHGRWIVFLDADDALLPGAAAKILAAAKDVIRVQWQTCETDAALRPTGRLVPSYPPTAGDVRALIERDGPFGVVNAHGCGTAWSREFLASAFPIPVPDFAVHCDAYLATLACLAGPSAVLDEPLSLYRVHGSNDYAGRSVAEQASRTLHVYRLRCSLISERTGVSVARWQAGNPHHDWLAQLERGCAELAELIPAGARYVLLDEDQWAAGKQLLPQRTNVTFPEAEGTYAGPPADDRRAAEEMRRVIMGGISHVVVAQPARWWTECYPELFRAVCAAGPLVRESDLVRVHSVG